MNALHEFTPLIVLVLLALAVLSWRIRQRKRARVTVCPCCLKHPATTISGCRKVCLICAYEETT